MIQKHWRKDQITNLIEAPFAMTEQETTALLQELALGNNCPQG
jgi:hypothetical protein